VADEGNKGALDPVAALRTGADQGLDVAAAAGAGMIDTLEKTVDVAEAAVGGSVKVGATAARSILNEMKELLSKIDALGRSVLDGVEKTVAEIVPGGEGD